MNLHVDMERVTWHAVTRFCQRVLDVAPIGGFKDPWAEAQAHLTTLGLSDRQVRAMMLTPKVQAEIALGRDRIQTDVCTFVIQNGCIITVIEGGAYWKRKKRIKIMSDKEGRRCVAQKLRRAK